MQAIEVLEPQVESYFIHDEVEPDAVITYDEEGNMLGYYTDDHLGHYTYKDYDYDVHTDYYYNNARLYDPAQGRWLSQDPLGYQAGDENLYPYPVDRDGKPLS